jgi:cytochrome c biogenesis protein CcmG/thiol:disulfide interchange protein DsbE
MLCKGATPAVALPHPDTRHQWRSSRSIASPEVSCYPVIVAMANSGQMGWLLVGALLAAAPACAPASNGAGSAALPATSHPLRGEPAPDFNLATRKGSPASLGAYAGHVLLIDFWATWCDPCRLSFPRYQALSSRHGDDVVVVGISEDDEDAGIDRFIEETGARFPVAWDGDKTLAQRYRINSMPTLFIIDKNGLVRYVHQGFRPGDEDQIDNAIKSLM